MEFTPANQDDIRRYYLNTFVKFRETGDALFYLKTVDNYKVEGQAHNGDILRLFLSEEHPYEVDYVLPHKSYYQLGKKAAQLFRIPAKQYQRGVGPENTEIRTLQVGKFHKQMLEFETLLPFVQKQKFFSLGDAGGAASEDYASCVLSPRMAFCRGTSYVFIDQTPVARLSANRTTLFIKYPVFLNEIKALLESNGEQNKYKVVCK